MILTVGKKITLAFAAVITMVAIMSGFTFYQVGELNNSYQAMMKANMMKVELAQGIATDVANEAVAMRRFNFTGDLADIPIFNDYRKLADEKIAALEGILKSEASKSVLQTIKKEKINYEAIAEKSIEAKKVNNTEQVALYMSQAGTPYKATMGAALELVKQIKEFVKTEEAANSAQARQMQLTLLIVNFFVAIIGMVIAVFISRSISRPAQELAEAAAAIAKGDLTRKDVDVRSEDEIGQLAQSFNQMKRNLRSVIRTVANATEQVAASSEELTASAEQSAQASTQVAGSITSVAEGASHQQSAVQNTSSVVEDVSAKLQEVAATSTTVAQRSEQAAKTAMDGGTAVTKAVTQMAQIQDTVTTSAQVVAKLGERSKEIGQIVDTISGIAGQTNLLALNAAIEAARAGEQGRGFAVVAEEVRKLAEQSQEAAKKIADLISEIQTDTNKAVVAMDAGTTEVKMGAEVVNRAGTAFKEIESIVVSVTGQVKEISTSIQEMALGSERIVTAVAEISESSRRAAEEAETVSAATEEQCASMEEIAASSQALAKLAEDLQTAVRKFTI